MHQLLQLLILLNPTFSTTLRALELICDVLIFAVAVDSVYKRLLAEGARDFPTLAAGSCASFSGVTTTG